MPRRERFANLVGALLAVCLVLVGGCAGGSFSVGPFNFDAASPRTGILLYADPGVTIARDGGLIGYEPGMEVVSGDRIETADGQAVLDYEDGSAVILNRATRVQLGSITLFFGEVFARIKSIATRGGAQVVTNELSASVEGTEFSVRRDLPAADAAIGNVQVYVREGRVLCAPGARARWAPIALTANQAFEVAGYRALLAVRTVDARTQSRWVDDTEKRLRKTRPPKIRPGMTLPIGPRPTPREPRREQPRYENPG